MAIRLITSAPATSDFTPLSEHQEQTPSTFFGGKPVLYANYKDLTLTASAETLQSHPAFAAFATVRSDDGDALVKDVEIWVNSEDLTIVQHTSASAPTGVTIPYPSIALHATMKYKDTVDALYMNLSLNDSEEVNDEDEVEVLEVTVLPPNYESSSPDTACIKEIYTAMNACADLHPDPEMSDDEDVRGDVDTAPGAGGWITAENMQDFMDEDGNIVFPGNSGGLGPGAGNVRPREDGDEGEDGSNTDGHNGVNGADGEGTKWQRTG